ncbi:MAG: hypothetical protein NT153_10515, partial [Bacteroidetes bacterium]|nr:hypothetical protein [Bacteroidota bacterium]
MLLIVLVIMLQNATNGYAESAGAIAVQDNFWLWRFLGRLHPLIVHFPVGLLVFSAIFELLTLKNFFSPLRSGIKLLLGAGILSAIFSVIAGLLLAKEGGYEKQLLTLHQWIGITTACLGGIAWIILYSILIKQQHYLIKYYRGVLWISALGVAIAGHFGASLTHGKDYLTATLPWSTDYIAPNKVNFDISSFKNDTSKLTKQQAAELNIQVRAILAHNCYKCHGAEKIKGDLRLDRKDMLFKGGENGVVVVPFKPNESELLRRITLPSNHKDAMPSKGKKLSEGDIAIIKFWIEKGAPWPDGAEAPIFRVAKLAPR